MTHSDQQRIELAQQVSREPRPQQTGARPSTDTDAFMDQKITSQPQRRETSLFDVPTSVITFRSQAHIVDECDRLGVSVDDRSDWLGETVQQTRERVRVGNTGHVQPIRDLLRKIESSIDTPQRIVDRAPSGAYPVVAEVIMGLPDSMRRRRVQYTQAAPVRIVLDTISSSVAPAQAIHARAAAVMALAVKLSETRPVRVDAVMAWQHRRQYGCATEHNSIVQWPVLREGGALTLAHNANALASGGLVRGFAYEYVRSSRVPLRNQILCKRCPGWFPLEGRRENKGISQMKQTLGLQESDVYLPHLYADDECVTDPVGWVRRELARHNQRTES